MTYGTADTTDILRYICRRFCICGELQAWEQITQGNINTTYKVLCDNKTETTAYLVQRINSYVFADPRQVMRNIDLVTRHITRKNKMRGIQPCGEQLHFYQADTGENYLSLEQDGEAEFWRVCNYIEDSVAFDKTNDLRILHGAGVAFGCFFEQLSDFDAQQLTETIPRFHDTRFRLERFFQHVTQDICGRCDEVREEIRMIAAAKAFGSSLSEKQDRGLLPLRVTHNDTKLSNVLFDKQTLQPLTVIDLDTVMAGAVAYDFGDAIRSAANTAASDEMELDKIRLDLGLFHAFSAGYLSQTADILTQAELHSLAQGAATVTLELAVRYLDDYITGDRYFKIKYPKYNLIKARCQLALFRDMMEKYSEMERIVYKIANMGTPC